MHHQGNSSQSIKGDVITVVSAEQVQRNNTLNISNPSLEERVEILKGGYYGKTFPKNHPIFKSKKSELETELRARGYDVLNKDKSQLQEKRHYSGGETTSTSLNYR